MALITTPKAADANSYCSLTDADDFLINGRTSTVTWSTATSQDKEKSLRYATYLLDRLFDWKGSVTTNEQALRWPRSGVVDSDGRIINANTIPAILARATSEFAVELLKKDRASDNGLLGLGFSEAKVGPISIKLDTTKGQETILTDAIVELLTELGETNGKGPSGGRIVKLNRS